MATEMESDTKRSKRAQIEFSPLFQPHELEEILSQNRKPLKSSPKFPPPKGTQTSQTKARESTHASKASPSILPRGGSPRLETPRLHGKRISSDLKMTEREPRRKSPQTSKKVSRKTLRRKGSQPKQRKLKHINEESGPAMSSHNSDDTGRKSHRQRFPPLKWWLHEQVQYLRKPGRICFFLAVIYKSTTVSRRLYSPRNHQSSTTEGSSAGIQPW